MAEKNETATQKPKWFQAEKVLIKAVKLIREPKEQELLKAVKFVTADNKEILYYPKNKLTTNSLVAEFDTEITEQKPYTMSEFVLNNKMLVALNKEIKEKGKPQEVIMTYQSSLFNDVVYYKMFRNQFTTIYFPKYHKTDKQKEETLETQLTAKQKYEVDIEYNEI